MLQCVSCTSRTLQIRLKKHIGDIRQGFSGHGVYKKHGGTTIFMGIDKFTSNWMGGEGAILEERYPNWRFIGYLLFTPFSLSIECDVIIFINNSWECFSGMFVICVVCEMYFCWILVHSLICCTHLLSIIYYEKVPAPPTITFFGKHYI